MEYLYLTEKEFIVLLFAVGCRQWSGFLNEEKFSGWNVENDMNKILSSLYQKGVLEWKNGKAVLLPSVRQIFELLNQVRQYVFFIRLDEDNPVEYLYILNTNVVRVRKSIHENGKLRLAFQSLEQIERELWETEIFPFNIELYGKKHPTECPEIKANVDELIQNNIVLAFEKRKFFDENPISRFLVKEDGIYNFYYIQKAGETRKYYENKNTVKKLFNSWIREVE